MASDCIVCRLGACVSVVDCGGMLTSLASFQSLRVTTGADAVQHEAQRHILIERVRAVSSIFKCHGSP